MIKSISISLFLAIVSFFLLSSERSTATERSYFNDLFVVIGVPDGDVLNVRELPTATSKTVDVKTNGDLLTVNDQGKLEINNGWIRVCLSFCMESGWVNLRYAHSIRVRTIDGTNIPLSGYCISDWETPHSGKSFYWSFPLKSARVAERDKFNLKLVPIFLDSQHLRLVDQSRSALVEINFSGFRQAAQVHLLAPPLQNPDASDEFFAECFPDSDAFSPN